MLKRWLELFPGDASDSDASDDTSLPENMFPERFYQVSASWPQLLRETCAIEDDYDACDWFQTFEDAARDASEAVWREALEAGFLLALAECIRTEFLCGFTREQLVTMECEENFDRVYLMLSLLLACTSRIVMDDRPQEVVQSRDVLQDTIIRVFVALWDTKDSFLVGEYITPDGEIVTLLPGLLSEWEDKLGNLYATLRFLGHLAIEMFQGNRSVNILGSRIPDVCLLIWIHSPYFATRASALDDMIHCVYEADPTNDMFPEFLADALGGSTSSKHVTDAIIRDLTDEDITDVALSDVMSFLLSWNRYHVTTGIRLAEEKELSFYCLAAARRQLCRGGSTDPATFIDIMLDVLDNLGLDLRIQGRQYYAVVDLLCEYASLCIQQNDAEPPAFFAEHMDWLLKHIQHRAKDDRPKTVALRTHTQAAWQAVTDEMQRRRLVHRSTAWMQFAQLWFVLQRHLWPLPAAGDIVRAPFGVFERCAWRECLCSRHKPAHKLRSCKGCEQVVYCGKRCQKSDWEKGGHRERCLRDAL
ncbi:zinc finger MYND domain-containing protein [Phanerochaete sordida]|uniref:Zinc finger MYND domain-containing protein n=1 Tax=Phanerochaete sordida TaxID=48140 RepID=A0A9P3GC22_9APHY|nr:zinc finger MYND domain-containing protein [Phanerochaete sordida]